MNVGALNKKIELQAATQTADGMGGFSEAYSTQYTAWSAIWPTSANEQKQAMQTDMIISHRIRIRYRSGVLSSWRIKYKTRYFNIVSIINPNEKNEMLDIMAKESV
jgi:SPP1 family predicted phage head-tail adaptor